LHLSIKPSLWCTQILLYRIFTPISYFYSYIVLYRIVVADVTGVRTTFVGDLPSFVYDGEDESLLVGWAATKSSIFRLRGVVWFFSLLTMAVMSATPYIGDASWSPSDYFQVRGFN
jgi:hypothetical protein